MFKALIGTAVLAAAACAAVQLLPDLKRYLELRRM
ncbi:hypothetical protein ABH925_007026 [Streptacidiphilus sp. EB129]